MTLCDNVILDDYVTSELSGAEIKAICTEAGLLALRERRTKVAKEDFAKARRPFCAEKPTMHLKLCIYDVFIFSLWLLNVVLSYF